MKFKSNESASPDREHSCMIGGFWSLGKIIVSRRFLWEKVKDLLTYIRCR